MIESTSTPVTESDQPSRAPARPKRKRTLLIVGGAVLTAAVLVGGGVAVGAELADDEDNDDRDTSQTSDRDETEASDGDVENAASAQSTEAGSDSAADLSEIIATASDSADGEPFAIDAERDGSWDVQFSSGAEDETEVRVTADGTATVISTEATEADDTAPLGVLDAATVDALVEAALAEVDGRITELDIDDDSASPFDVTVVSGDGRTTDIALDAEFNVLATDRD